MLGAQIGEDKGKIDSQRVVDVAYGIPKLEISFNSEGKWKGVETSEISTYWSTTRPDGSLYGQGQGVLKTKDGKEIATWTGQGIGKSIGGGKIRFAGSLFFKTASSGQLSFLNDLVGVFEYESDDKGNTSSKIWEWK